MILKAANELESSYRDLLDLSEILQESKTTKDSTTDISEEELKPITGFQPPIKGDWKVSGIFSLSPTDARHPKGHLGVDMRAPAGTPIYPMAPGVVTNVGSTSVGGYIVNIDHGNGLTTYYAHCSTIKVQKGDKVNYNTQIATVGDTGNAKGTFPHLHFQVAKNGQEQNPNQYFTVPAYTNLGKEEKFWLSEQAKEEAKSFDFKKHVSSAPKSALAHKIENITKIANNYYLLCKEI